MCFYSMNFSADLAVTMFLEHPTYLDKITVGFQKNIARYST